MILVFIRLVKSPLSKKNWCIALIEMASGAIALFSRNGWIIALVIDFTIIGIDSFDSMLYTNDDAGNHSNGNHAIEVASRNIAKISVKEVFRIIVKESLKMSTEVLLKSAANKTISIIAKKVPFYGLIFGIVFAVNRIAQGNRQSVKVWILAASEIASGLISVIPYIGTILSFLIDMLITLVDISDSFIEKKKQKKESDPSKKPTTTTPGLFILWLFKSLLFYILLMSGFFIFIIFSFYVMYGDFETCFLGCCNLFCNLGCNFTGNIFCL